MFLSADIFLKTLLFDGEEWWTGWSIDRRSRTGRARSLSQDSCQPIEAQNSLAKEQVERLEVTR